jgi:beta-N-acetylhexosaminidase
VTRLAAIFGCAGPRLLPEEAAFFRDVRPWGFILFRRNVETPEQVRALTEALGAAVDDADTPVLVDQEGGRVQRLGPPPWRRYPPAGAYRRLLPAQQQGMVRLGARLIAHDLALVGINVDCAPVLDVPALGAHDVIGDRAYGEAWMDVAALGRAAAEGLIAGGVLPVLKHIPGHGRALADSHESLPLVDAPLAVLERDFEPFRVCSDMPMAMTSHIVYAAIDPDNPATLSSTVIHGVIRGSIGFDGVLMTDDLSMKALSGSFETRARRARAAGCDLVLHCNGEMAEMKGVAAGAGALDGQCLRRTEAALARLPFAPEPFDPLEGWARFTAAFGGLWAP